MALRCQVRKAEIRQARDKLLTWKRGWSDRYKDSAESGDGSATGQPWRILIQECPNPPPTPTSHHQSCGRVKVQVGQTEQRRLGWGTRRARLGFQQRDSKGLQSCGDTSPRPLLATGISNRRQRIFKQKLKSLREKKKKSQDLTFNIFPVGKVLKVRPSSRGDTTTQQVCRRSPDFLLSSECFRH